MFKSLLSRFHKHKWKETLWNGFYIAVEEKCQCGELRHHLFKNLKGFDKEWQPGKHPNKPIQKSI